MAFKSLNTIDAPEFYNILMNESKELTIEDVSDIKYNEDDGSKYIFIYYLMRGYFDSIRVSYNLNIKTDESGNEIIKVPEDSKLYPIVSYASGLNDSSIGCSIEDLKGMIGDKFFASAKRGKIGNKSYYKIIPKKRGN